MIGSRALFRRAVGAFSLRGIARIRHEVIVTSLVIPCLDARFLETQHEFCARVLRLGKRDRDWISLPIAGGAAAFAHPDRIPEYFGTLEKQLQVVLEHFPSVNTLISLGHQHCNFVANLHKGEQPPTADFDWVLKDCQTVARAVENRRIVGDCKIGRAVKGFTGDVRIFYTGIKPGTTTIPLFTELTKST